MRRSKRMRSPDGWITEYSWEERVEVHKRPRRSSHSAERDKKPSRHHHYKTYERCHISAKRLECRDRRAREASPGRDDYGSRVDSIRETENNERHYSKSSARSRRSSREHRRSRHHTSNSVNNFSCYIYPCFGIPALTTCSFLCHDCRVSDVFEIRLK